MTLRARELHGGMMRYFHGVVRGDRLFSRRNGHLEQVLRQFGPGTRDRVPRHERLGADRSPRPGASAGARGRRRAPRARLSGVWRGSAAQTRARLRAERSAKRPVFACTSGTGPDQCRAIRKITAISSQAPFTSPRDIRSRADAASGVTRSRRFGQAVGRDREDVAVWIGTNWQLGRADARRTSSRAFAFRATKVASLPCPESQPCSRPRLRPSRIRFQSDCSSLRPRDRVRRPRPPALGRGESEQPWFSVAGLERRAATSSGRARTGRRRRRTRRPASGPA